MIESQKSGQKIKAKISKVPLSTINTMRMTEITTQKNNPHANIASPTERLYSSPLLVDLKPNAPSPHKTPENSQEAGKACHLDEQQKQMLKYFNIPQNYLCQIQPSDDYCHKICRDRVSMFQNAHNLQLDVRDERVKIPFKSQALQGILKSGRNGEIEPLLDQIRDWLIDLIQITCSISFNHLKKGNISEKEVKNYAAKNILLNIKEMFQVLTSLSIANRYNIMKFVNQHTQKIIENTIMKYPQTSSKGASRRIKSKVRRIDNREDDQFDFLFRNNIKIPYRKSGDYSQDVMKIINKLISFATDAFNPEGDSQETNYEVFTEVMEHIFENSWSQPTETTVSDIREIINRKMLPKGENFILNSTNMTELREALSFSERVDKKSTSSKDLSNKDYLIGQKIPSATPLYSEKELEGGSFKVYDSSILRIITKWTEELREKIQNAEEAISKRSHKFKIKNGKFISLDASMKEKLYFAAKQEEATIRAYLQYLNKENTALQIVFAEESNIGKESKHDTKVGIFSAKINEIASQYMFKYINKLIHSLLRIPRVAAAEVNNETERNLLSTVNLVTLKIGDLMRSKYSCSEQQFLRILSVLEQIDCKHPEIIKIVRIKNRLDQKDSDVLINIYFMEKVECEIQLSIKGLYNKVEKDYTNFNHFLYQIIRSKLGPISELANIVTQYDPLIHHFKRMNQFGPELLQKQWVKDKKKLLMDNLIERLKFKRQMGVARSLELPFICCKCLQLSIVTNPRFYYHAGEDLKLVCNKCRFIDMIEDCSDEAFSYLMQQSFKDSQVRNFFVNHLDHWDFEKEIKQMQDDEDPQSCRMLDVPLQGFYLKKISKLPKMALYSAVYEPVSNCYHFMSVDQKGTKNIIAKIPMYLQKKKRIETFKKEFDHFYFFKLKDTRKRVEDGNLYLTCTDEKCCKKEMKAGPILTSDQILQFCHSKAIQNSLNNQKSLLDLNFIPKSLHRVEQSLALIQDPNKSDRITRSIQHIKAAGCSISSIQAIAKFHNLTDLNINDNRQVTSLKGLEECLLLKNLECKNCDLQAIDELALLKRIQNLNLKGNANLKNIKGVTGHTELVDLNIGFTSVASLEPLQRCLKMESLNIEQCRDIMTLAPINSSKLTYLNMVGCSGLQLFDLALHSSKSLKTIQYCRKNQQKVGFQLILASLNFLEDDEEAEANADEKGNSTYSIEKINDVLKFNKRKAFEKLLIRTVP